MGKVLTREEAWELLNEYNKEPFHLRHGETVEGVMRYLAQELGYGDEVDFWGNVGLLHDLDFEQWPEEHCAKVQELMRERDIDERMIHAVASHGYGICCDIAPEHEMEKVLFAVDELTGLIGAAALMRPSKSVKDMELKSVKKKFKDKHFAAGCDREIIPGGNDELKLYDLAYFMQESQTLHFGSRKLFSVRCFLFRKNQSYLNGKFLFYAGILLYTIQ